MTRFTRTGKQIMQDGKHMADAVDETAAMMITNALCAMGEQRWSVAPDEIRKMISDPTVPIRTKQRPTLNLNHCQQRREGDEYACVCGLRWSVDDDDPPLCAHRAPR